MCHIDRLMELTDKYKIPVIEDASESLGSYWKGKHSGTFGTMGVFSFNGNKIITTGGGGVLVTNDQGHAKRAKHLSTQSKVNPETYYHDEIGFNYRLCKCTCRHWRGTNGTITEFYQKEETNRSLL